MYNLVGAELRGLTLPPTTLIKNANFQQANLAGAHLDGVRFRNTSFSASNLENVSLVGARLSGVDFRGAKVIRANLSALIWNDDEERPPLYHCDGRLAEAAPLTELSYADLRGADFGGSHMRGVIACGIAADDAEFSGADLSYADLQSASAPSAKFWGTDLSNANLDYADLRNGAFPGADIKGATFRCTDLRGADLTETRNLVDAQIAKALIDDATKLPHGARRPDFDCIETLERERDRGRLPLHRGSSAEQQLSKGTGPNDEPLSSGLVER